MSITSKKNIVFFTYGSSSPRMRKFAQAEIVGSFLKVEDLISKFENEEELPGDYIENTLDIYAVAMNGDIYEVAVTNGAHWRRTSSLKAVDARGRYK